MLHRIYTCELKPYQTRFQFFLIFNSHSFPHNCFINTPEINKNKHSQYEHTLLIMKYVGLNFHFYFRSSCPSLFVRVAVGSGVSSHLYVKKDATNSSSHPITITITSHCFPNITCMVRIIDLGNCLLRIRVLYTQGFPFQA